MPLKDPRFCKDCTHMIEAKPISFSLCGREGASYINVVSGKNIRNSCAWERKGNCGPYGRYFTQKPPRPTYRKRIHAFMDRMANAVFDWLERTTA